MKSNNVAFMSGDTTFSPDMRELIQQTVETMKLDIIQGLAYERAPKVFRRQGIKKNPSMIGGIVSERLKSLPGDTKRNRPDYKVVSSLGALYTADIRNIARKHNVDMMSKTAVTKQFDPAKKYAFMTKELLDEKRHLSHAENLFGMELEASAETMTAGKAIMAAAPALNLDPAVARMLVDFHIIDKKRWKDIVGGVGVKPGKGGGKDTDDDDSDTPPGIVLNGGLHYRLHRVKCVDETNPEWPGDDEIAAGGVAINWDESSSEISEFRVGSSFDDGESKYYTPPRILKTYTLEGASYPANFSVIMAMSEKDSGGTSAFIRKLWEAIRDHVDKILVAVGAAAGTAAGIAIGGKLGTAIGGPLGLIIGAVAGAIVGALVGWLIQALKDDLFPPQAAALRLPAPTSTFNNGALTSPIMTLNFRAHGGHYRAYYSWEIIR